MILNCIAIDDEPLALNLVCNFIEQTPFLQLVGRYSNAIEALKEIHTQETDLVFLDIQMSDLNGMELAKLLNQGTMSHKPKVIFTTAYNHFALEGYKVDALDYLLKPFNYEEFLRAANKGRQYTELMAGSQVSIAEEEEFLFLKVEMHWVKVAFRDILFIESLKDYVNVHLLSESRPILSLGTLKALEEKLPSKRFLRVHRSFIVSLDQITSITKTSLQVGNTTIAVGEQYRDAFKQFINRWIL